MASEEPLSKSLFGPPLESAFDHEDFTGRGGVRCRKPGRVCGGATGLQPRLEPKRVR